MNIENTVFKGRALFFSCSVYFEVPVTVQLDIDSIFVDF